ncbi:MAG TPA: SIR2 family protein [Longimicrobium sp.]|jgi:hypothetical protein
MGEIKRILDTDGKPTFDYRGALRSLARQLLNGEGLIFLGAGAAAGTVDGTSLPTASDLSRKFAKECRLEWHEYVPLSTVAFYYESFFSRDELNAFLRENLNNPKAKPSKTITTLVELVALFERKGVQALIVTTNYDDHFERAYEKVFGYRPEVIIYNGGTDANDDAAHLHPGIRHPHLWLPKKPTYLYKMHGCISQATGRNLVITEEDYINFLSNALSHNEHKRLLPYVLANITEWPTLFVGYSLSDWNFRVIYKATAERSGTRSYAVQLFTPKEGDETQSARWNATVGFWGKKNVDIINVDASTFMQDLLASVQELVESSPDRT